MTTMGNGTDIEITISDNDKTDPGKVRGRWRAAMQGMVKDTEQATGQQRDEFGRFIAGTGKDADNNDVGKRFGKKVLNGLKDVFAVGTKSVAVTIATAFSASFLGQLGGALASGAGKIAHGIGAAFALLPAAMLAGGLAAGALKVGLLGVGDALKAGLAGDTAAFEEALKGLAPEAAQVVREFAALKPALSEIKSAVQGNLFGPLIGQLGPLASSYLPLVGGALMNIAAQFGQAAKDSIAFLTIPETVSKMGGAFINASTAVGNMVGGLEGLLQAFLPLVTVGSSFLPGLTDGFGGATERLAAFMQEAERTGQLAGFIQGGLDKLNSLWDTLRKVGELFGVLRSIGTTLFGGIDLTAGKLLDKTIRLAEGFRDFVGSAKGTSTVQQLMQTLRSVIDNVFGTLQRLGGIIARTFGPYIPQLLAFVDAFMRLKSAILDSGFDVLEPVLAVLAEVLLGRLLPAITTLMNFLAENQTVIQAIGIAIAVMLVPAIVAWGISAGIAAINTLLMLAPILLIGAAIAAFAYLVITHWDTIKQVTAIVWQAVLGFIQGAFNWVRDNWPLILAILTGPFGVAVLVIVRNWQTIKDAVGAAVGWIKDRMSDAKNWIVDRFNDVVSFVTGLPGRITSAASNMWNGIKDAFRNTINAVLQMWNNISFTLPKISIPSVDVPGLGKIGGGSFGGQTFSTPNVPLLKSGGRRSGMAIVGEAGPELVDFGGTPGNVTGANGTREAKRSAGVKHETHNHFYIRGSVIGEKQLFQMMRDGKKRGDLPEFDGAAA